MALGCCFTSRVIFLASNLSVTYRLTDVVSFLQKSTALWLHLLIIREVCITGMNEKFYYFFSFTVHHKTFVALKLYVFNIEYQKCLGEGILQICDDLSFGFHILGAFCICV